MYESSNHIIQSVCFETTTADEATAHELTDFIQLLNLEDRFDQVLSKYNEHKEPIWIDRIELDLGAIESWDGIARLVSDEFEKALQQKIPDFENRGIPEQYSLVENKKQVEKPRHSSVTQNNIALVIFYLQSGSLPWYADNKTDVGQLIENFLKEEAAPEFIQALTPALASNKVRRRLLYALSAKGSNLLMIQLLGSAEWKAIKLVLQQVQKKLAIQMNVAVEAAFCSDRLFNHMSSGIQSRKEFAKKFIDTLATFLPERTTEVELENFLVLLQKEMVKGAPKVSDQTVSHQTIDLFIKTMTAKTRAGNRISNPPDSTLSDPILSDSILPLSKTETFNKEIAGTTEMNTNSDASDPMSEQVKKSSAKKDERKTLGNKDKEEQDIGSFFIDNAGLVLLNAGLISKYFAQAGWTKEKSFADETAQQKAMLWLDYLVWGKRKTHEYGLTFNKILVGIEPKEVVDTRLRLSKKERVAAEELLTTIIQHWTALGRTSSTVLQQTFLQRNGRVTNTDGGWQLHVETKPYDVLIDLIPWTFSIIKFPWMSKPLFTQWSTKI